MARIHLDGLAALLGADLAAADTVVSFDGALSYAGGVPVPTIAAPDVLTLSVLDADGRLAELLEVTAYTSGTPSATVTRGVGATSPMDHDAGAAVKHAPVAADLEGLEPDLAYADLTDVDLTGLLDGQVPVWDETAGKWVPGTPESGGAVNLADLGDVDLTGQANGDFLSRVGGVWVPVDAPSGGGGGGGGGGGVTPPEVVSCTTYSGNGSGPTLTLPDDVQADDLIVVQVLSGYNVTSISSGYVVLQNHADYVATFLALRSATGGEGGTDISLAFAGAYEWLAAVTVVRGAGGIDSTNQSYSGGAGVSSFEVATFSRPGSLVITAGAMRTNAQPTMAPGTVIGDEVNAQLGMVVTATESESAFARQVMTAGSGVNPQAGMVIISFSGEGGGGGGSAYPERVDDPTDATWGDASALDLEWRLAPDEDSPDLGPYAFVNESTTTWEAKLGRLVLTPPDSGGENLRMLVAALPGDPTWEVTGKFSRAAFPTNWTRWGLVLRRASTGKLTAFGYAGGDGNGAQPTVNNWNSPTSYGGDEVRVNMGQPQYVRVAYDGTDYDVLYSDDGAAWAPMIRNRAAFDTYDQVGIVFQNRDGVTQFGLEWLRYRATS